MSVDKDKSLLDEYLADDPRSSTGESELTRQYRNLPGAEPAGHLDRAILAEAREAVRSDQASRAESFWSAWSSWLKPLTVVAAMGICLVLVLQVMQSNQRQLERSLGPIGGMAEGDAKRDSVDELVMQTDRPAVELPVKQRGDAAVPAAISEPTMRARAEREEQLFDLENRQQFEDAAAGASANFGVLESRPSAPLLAEAPSPRVDGEEVIVTARKTEESLQDVPLSMSVGIGPESAALPARAGVELTGDADMAVGRAEMQSDGFDEIIVATRKAGVDDAANEILYPARDVWRAGLDAIRAKGDLDLSQLEQQKFLLVYPDEAPAERSADAVADTLPDTVTNASAGRGLEFGADEVAQPQPIVPPAAEVWLAGIDYLLGKGEQARAEDELLRFQAVYPTHPAVTGGIGEDY